MKFREAGIPFPGIFLLLVTVSCSKVGERCETPNRDQGTCVEVMNCPPLFNLIQTKPISPATQDLLKKSGCGYTRRQPLVCCSSTNPTPSSPQPQQSIDTEVTEDVGQHANLQLLRSDICGSVSTNRIFKGNKTDLGEYPWMALVNYTVGNKHQFGCAGSIISDRYILTAAHCVTLLPENVFPVSVRLGEHDLESDLDCEEYPDGAIFCAPAPQDILIEEIIPHPRYTGKPNMQHDIALIRLSRPADFTTEFVLPICLPIGIPQQTKDLVGKRLQLSGWGITENDKKSSQLLIGFVPIAAHEQCANTFGGIAPISALSQVCVSRDQASCMGDSGGPLFSSGEMPNFRKFMQHGVMSFGPKECSTGELGVYTRVGHFMKWILDNIKE